MSQLQTLELSACQAPPRSPNQHSSSWIPDHSPFPLIYFCLGHPFNLPGNKTSVQKTNLMTRKLKSLSFLPKVSVFSFFVSLMCLHTRWSYNTLPLLLSQKHSLFPCLSPHYSFCLVSMQLISTEKSYPFFKALLGSHPEPLASHLLLALKRLWRIEIFLYKSLFRWCVLRELEAGQILML